MKRARTMLISAFAGLGLLVAHSLGYEVAGQRLNPHKAQSLASTGHDYFLYVVAAITALSVFLLARYTSRRLNERSAPSISGLQLFCQAGVRLIPLQIAAFVLLEFFERVFFAGGLTNVLGEPAVQMGLLFQVIVALLGALLLSVFAGAIEAIRRRSRISSARRNVTRIYPKTAAPQHRRLALAESGTGLRSPPSLL